MIYAVQTEAQAKDLVSLIEHAIYYSRRAVIAGNNKDFFEANRQWNVVFNLGFI